MNKEELYYKAPIDTMRRKDLTLVEIGLISYLRSHKDNYIVSETSICRQFSCDSRTLKKLLQSLHNKGFINELNRIKDYQPLLNNNSNNTTTFKKANKSLKIAKESQLKENNKQNKVLLNYNTPIVKLQYQTLLNYNTRITKEEQKKKEISKENIIKSGNNSNTLVTKKATSNKEAKQQTFSKVKTKNSATLAIDSLPINITNDFTKLGLEIVKYLDLEAEYQQFRNHYIIKGYKIRDWLFKWQSWLNKAVEYGKDVQTSLTLMHKEQQMDTFVTILSDDEVLKAKSETKQEYKRNKQLQEALHTYFNAKCTQLDLFSKEKYQQLFSKYRKRPFLVLSNGKEYQEIEKFINNTERYDWKIASNLDKELLNEPLPNTKEFKDDWKQRAINTCKEFNIDCSELLNENFDLNSFSNDMHNAFMRQNGETY